MKLTFKQITDRETGLLRRAFNTFAKGNPDKITGLYTRGIKKVQGREYIVLRSEVDTPKVLAVFRVTTEGHLRRIYKRWPKELADK